MDVTIFFNVYRIFGNTRLVTEWYEQYLHILIKWNFFIQIKFSFIFIPIAPSIYVYDERKDLIQITKVSADNTPQNACINRTIASDTQIPTKKEWKHFFQSSWKKSKIVCSFNRSIIFSKGGTIAWMECERKTCLL